LSHQREREKKRIWRKFCEWLPAAVAHLPTAVSLLLLEALFMQISGVSLTLTWSLRLCLLRVLLGATTTATSPFQALRKVTLHLLSLACVFIYSTHEKWAFPLLLWSFPPTATFTSFPTPGCSVCAAAPAFSSGLVVRDFPSPALGVHCAPPSLLHVFFVVISYYSVFFLFSLGGGWSVQGAMLI
jgi:hypothetical protein